MHSSHFLTEDVLSKSPEHVIVSNQIYDTRTYTYIRYSKDAIDDYLSTNYCAFELLPEKLPRKFYVDIDIKPDEMNYNKYSFDEIINQVTRLLKASLELLDAAYSFNESDVFACYAKNIKIKQSLHIVYPVYFNNQKDLKEFAAVVYHKITHEEYPALCSSDGVVYFDKNVYGRNQNMRCLYQSKYGKQNRLFPLDKKKGKPSDYLLGIYENADRMPYVNREKLRSVAIEIVAKKTFKAPKEEDYSFVSGYLDELAFGRTYKPADSKPNKEKKNAIEFYVSCVPNSNEKPQTYKMWQSIGQAMKNLSAEHRHMDLLQVWIDWSLQAGENYTDEAKACRELWPKLNPRATGNKYKITFLKQMAIIYNYNAVMEFEANRLCDELFTLDTSGFKTVDVYNEDWGNLDTEGGYCKAIDFKDSKVYASLCGMGLGKTTQTFEFLKGLDPKRMIMPSPRRSFSKQKVAEYAHVFPGLIDYMDKRVQDSKDWLEFDKIAVQVESLHRFKHIDEDTKYDVVVLDELESTLAQFSSPTNGKRAMRNFNTFAMILLYASKVVICDAFLSNRSMEFVKVLCKVLGEDAVISINRYKRRDRTAVILGNATNCGQAMKGKQKFVAHILNELDAGKNLVIVSGSLKFKEAIIDTVVKKMGADFRARIKDYDSNTIGDHMKDLDDVNNAWGNEMVRMLVYTTTFTVGISFDLVHFDSIYIYGTSISSVPRDLIQAHYRVRKIRDNKIYVSVYSGNPADGIPELEDEVTKNIYLDNMFGRKYAGENWSSEEFEELYTAVRDYNCLEQHLSHTQYYKVLKYLLEETGYKIAYDDNEYEAIEIIRERKEFQNYHDIKLTPLKTVEQLEEKIKKGKATKEEGIAVDAYYFYNSIVLKSNLVTINHSFSEINANMTKDEFEKMSFEEYMTEKMFKIYLDNMVAEVCWRNNDITLLKNRERVIDDQKYAMKVMFVQEIVSKLQIQVSFNKDLDIVQDNMLEVYQYYKRLSKDEKLIFNEVFSVPKLDCKTDAKNAKRLVASCIKSWNGMSLKSRLCGRDQKDKKDVRVYKYNIEQVNELLSTWAQLL